MGNVGDVAFSKGDVMRRLHDLERMINAFAYGRSLEAATIGSGGLRVVDNGSIIVEEGGSITALGPDGGYTRLVDGELRFLSGNFSNDIPGRLIAQQGPIRGLWIVPPRPPGDALGDNWIFVFARDGNSAVGRAGMTTTGLIDIEAGANVLITADGQFTTSSGTGGYFITGGTSVVINAGTDGFFTATDSLDLTGDGGLFLQSTNGQVQVNSGTNQVFIQHATTSDAANAVLSTFGLLERSTSSRRYKQNIQDFAVNPREVIELQPRTWRDKKEVERNSDTDRWHVGLVAEEVEEAGLGAFLSYTEDGEPDAVNYDRLVVALLEVVKDQDKRIKSLETRLKKLDSQDAGTVSRKTTIIPPRLPETSSEVTPAQAPSPPEKTVRQPKRRYPPMTPEQRADPEYRLDDEGNRSLS